MPVDQGGRTARRRRAEEVTFPGQRGCRRAPNSPRSACSDMQADIAFTFTFSEYENGTQTGMVWYATGAEARQPEPA